MVPCLLTYVPSKFVQSDLTNWCHCHAPSQKLHVHRISGHVILSTDTSGKCWAFAFVHSMSHAQFVYNNCHLRLARHGMTSIVADSCLEACCCWSPSLADELGLGIMARAIVVCIANGRQANTRLHETLQLHPVTSALSVIPWRHPLASSLGGIP